MKRVLLALALLGGATSAHAQAPLTFGLDAQGGNGCPQESDNLKIDATALTVTARFAGYAAAVDGTGLDRKTCNFGIQVTVPDGMRVAVFATDYRGTLSIGGGATAVLSVEGFFAGDEGTAIARTYEGPWAGTFIASRTVPVDERVWSACGADLVFRANTSIRVTGGGGAANANLDLVRVRLAWQAC